MPTALSYIYFNSKINLILLVIFTIYTGNVNCPVNTSSESFISVKPYALEIVSLSAQTDFNPRSGERSDSNFAQKNLKNYTKPLNNIIAFYN